MYSLLCHCAEQGCHGHDGAFKDKKKGRRGLGNGQKRQTTKTAGEKIKSDFFSNQLPGFTVITKNLDASERRHISLYAIWDAR